MRPHSLLLPVALLLLAGCTVYAPMQPSLPLLTEKGQADIGASIQPNGRLEATAAYSPWDRVVVLGGFTGLPRLGERNYLTTAQYELGGGVYQPLGNWLLGAQLGFGQAYSRRSYEEISLLPLLFIPTTTGNLRQYEASYQKQFVQAGVAYQGVLRSVSLTYRFTRVGFNYLNDADYGPLPLSRMLRHELALGSRLSLFGSERWQLASTAGLSFSAEPPIDTGSYPSQPLLDRANDNLAPAFFFSLGVVFRLGTYW